MNSIKEIAIKKWLKNIDSNTLAGLVWLFTSIILIPFIINEWIPSFWDSFFIAFIFWSIMYFWGKYLNFTALSIWDISYISPLKALVTINVVFTSFIILWEKPNIYWFLWIIIIAIWSYILSIKKEHTNLLDPIKHLFLNKWSRIYLLVTILYGFTVTIDKIWVNSSSPIFWTFCMNFMVFLFSLWKILSNYKFVKIEIKNNFLIFTIIILLHTLIYVSQMVVISNILASYTSAFKTSSSLFAVIIWWKIFNEENLFIKFIATLIMILGVILISFSWYLI